MKKKHKQKTKKEWLEYVPYYRLFFPKNLNKPIFEITTMYFTYSILILAALFYSFSPFPVSYYSYDNNPTITSPDYNPNITFKKVLTTVPLDEQYIAIDPKSRAINDIWVTKIEQMMWLYVLLLGLPILTQFFNAKSKKIQNGR